MQESRTAISMELTTLSSSASSAATSPSGSAGAQPTSASPATNDRTRATTFRGMSETDSLCVLDQNNALCKLNTLPMEKNTHLDALSAETNKPMSKTFEVLTGFVDAIQR